jgi:hypothetical protein
MVHVVDALEGKPRSPGDSHRLARLFALDGLFVIALLLLARLWVPCANAQVLSSEKSDARSLDLQSFPTELRRIQDTLQRTPSQPDQIAALEKSLPLGWEVETPERKYEISAEPLHSLLNDARNEPSQRNQRVTQAQEWIAELASQVNAYAADGQATPDARARLERILNSPEFGSVYRESAWERFKQRVAAWIWQKAGEWLQRMSGHPIAARAMAWLILLLAVAGVALLLFRAWTRRARFEELKAPAAPALQSWQEWIHTAQLAADRGAYRDAVHALYWAGIVYLENSRILLREPSRTPRERLRHLRFPPQPGDDDVKRRDLLQALTSGLERVWYAGAPATRQDFLETSRLVQELGCRWQ